MSDQLSDDQTHGDTTGGVSNSLAVVGFTLSLCAVVFFWIPYLNAIMWVLGVVLSWVGLRRARVLGGTGKGLHCWTVNLAGSGIGSDWAAFSS